MPNLPVRARTISLSLLMRRAHAMARAGSSALPYRERFRRALRHAWASADDITMQLVTIDENLIRRDLSPAERAEQTARRKELYEALHPETAHGGDRASRQSGDLKDHRFTRATAQATNLSERLIQRAAHHGEQLADVIPRIKGTSPPARGPPLG